MSLELIGSQLNGEANGDFFGFSTALSGDGTVLAVSAPLNEGNESSNQIQYYGSGGWTTYESNARTPLMQIVGADVGSVKVYKRIYGYD